MTQTELVARKLATLIEYTRRAGMRRPSTPEQLAADIERQDALGMALLVAIQEAIDLAFHIVTDERWGAPSSYADGFELLAKGGVIGPELALEMTRATGLRNRLAHGYATIDVPRLWAELPRGLDALGEYARAIGEYASRVPG